MAKKLKPAQPTPTKKNSAKKPKRRSESTSITGELKHLRVNYDKLVEALKTGKSAEHLRVEQQYENLQTEFEHLSEQFRASQSALRKFQDDLAKDLPFFQKIAGEKQDSNAYQANVRAAEQMPPRTNAARGEQYLTMDQGETRMPTSLRVLDKLQRGNKAFAEAMTELAPLVQKLTGMPLDISPDQHMKLEEAVKNAEGKTVWSQLEAQIDKHDLVIEGLTRFAVQLKEII